MTKIKICGLCGLEDVEAVNRAGADYAGFILNFPKSRRNISMDLAARLKQCLHPSIPAVGVIVSQPLETAAALANSGIIDAIQLHGEEDEDYIAALRRLIRIPIWKAFRVHTEEDIKAAMESSADRILLDNGYGTGEPFCWTLAEEMKRPFTLAGGLTPETIPDAVSLLHPEMVDISSGVETDGRKDPVKIQAAVNAAHITV